MKDVGKFLGHLVYFNAIWSILMLFGILNSHLVVILEHFPPFCCVVRRKIWQPSGVKVLRISKICENLQQVEKNLEQVF
jgi:hypothetical protein